MSGLISYLPESEVAVARLCYQLPDFVTSYPTRLCYQLPDFVTSCSTLLPVARPDLLPVARPDLLPVARLCYQLPDFVTSCPTRLVTSSYGISSCLDIDIQIIWDI